MACQKYYSSKKTGYPLLYDNKYLCISKINYIVIGGRCLFLKISKLLLCTTTT